MTTLVYSTTYINFMINYVYDNANFLTDEVPKTESTLSRIDCQKIVEKPQLYILGQSGYDSKKHECEHIINKSGDNPARQFESGQQRGGQYSCLCGVDSKSHINLELCFKHKACTLEERRQIIMQGKIVSKMLKEKNLNPLRNMKKNDLIDELEDRHVNTHTWGKPRLQQELNDILHGISRPPALMTSAPEKSVQQLNLDSYESERISENTSNRKAGYIIENAIIRYRAQEDDDDRADSSQKQESEISKLAKSLPPKSRTTLPQNFIKDKFSLVQCHLSRIAAFLLPGENVWWHFDGEDVVFHDSVQDEAYRPEGPNLSHIRSTSLKNEFIKNEELWQNCITLFEKKVLSLPIQKLKIRDLAPIHKRHPSNDIEANHDLTPLATSQFSNDDCIMESVEPEADNIEVNYEQNKSPTNQESHKSVITLSAEFHHAFDDDSGTLRDTKIASCSGNHDNHFASHTLPKGFEGQNERMEPPEQPSLVNGYKHLEDAKVKVYTTPTLKVSI
ncbi:unnamed protein product [Mytilus coruscus]|uniref:Uncharacterized protein n=1 Tax=Mytilus coruscus TaxID=42192 RepID=A0A6J8ENU8_MYTCO|nr:unnamed protein product [Mytilus coruscus]